jgi:hypothetical protein
MRVYVKFRFEGGEADAAEIQKNVSTAWKDFPADNERQERLHQQGVDVWLILSQTTCPFTVVPEADLLASKEISIIATAVFSQVSAQGFGYRLGNIL